MTSSEVEVSVFVPADHIYSDLGPVHNGTHKQLAEKPEKMCPICKKILPADANLSFHRMLHPWTEKPYACDHCLFVSMTREELSEHCKEAHPSNRKFICAVCSKEFTNIRTLNKHKPTHALVMPFSCAYCDKGFPEYGYWRQHEVAHKTARFQCEDCLVGFTTIKFYNDHREKESCKTKILECCKRKFSVRMDYVKHCFDNHRFQKKDEYGCQFCGRLYAFKCVLNLHMRRCRLRKDKSDLKNRTSNIVTNDSGVRSELPTDSEIPESSFSSVINETENGGRQVFSCDLCDRTFFTKSWLVQHRQRHLDPEFSKYICQLCNKKYGSYSALYYHKQRIHFKIKRFKCAHCEKTFYDGQSLRDHETSHTGEQPYACSYCPKKFRNRSSKIEHHRIHTGERPYQCRFCDQRFKRRNAKMSHERRHTGEKPYKCRVCDRCFTQDSTWRSHERKHQPPFSCTQCDLVFPSKDSLINHKLSHSEVALEQESYGTTEWQKPVNMVTDEEGHVYISYEVVS